MIHPIIERCKFEKIEVAFLDIIDCLGSGTCKQNSLQLKALGYNSFILCELLCPVCARVCQCVHTCVFIIHNTAGNKLHTYHI